MVLRDLQAAAKKKTGLAGLEEMAKEVAEELTALNKQLEEFPDDPELANKFKAQETKMKLLAPALANVAKSDKVSGAQAEKMKALKQQAAEKKVYNKVFGEALPIARGGDEMEL